MASDLSPEDKPELGDDQPHEVLFYFKALLSIWSCKCLFLFLYQERRKEMFYLTMHSTHFLIRHMVKYHSYSERGNLLALHGLYSFRSAARVLLYASSHRPVVEHWLEWNHVMSCHLGLTSTFRASCYSTHLSWAHSSYELGCVSRTVGE